MFVVAAASCTNEQKRQCKSIELRRVSFDSRLDNGYCVRILAFEREPPRFEFRTEKKIDYIILWLFMKVALPVSIRDQWRATKRVVESGT